MPDEVYALRQTIDSLMAERTVLSRERDDLVNFMAEAYQCLVNDNNKSAACLLLNSVLEDYGFDFNSKMEIIIKTYS